MDRERAARFSDDANPGLYRIAHKMATGTGKTVVMAMLIAWHTLNKTQNPQDGRFSDSFLVAAPGIAIRDRLRVLLPPDPDNYYRQRDIVPTDRVADLGRAKIVITNCHAFRVRSKALCRACMNHTGSDGGWFYWFPTPVGQVCSAA